ncbi:MAG: radical SAM protein [Parcubacteria group bacterium]|nr:radical SAM protein [Parcubacteria group bacterium]
MTDEVIDALTLPKQINYLHLAVQSGDNKILKKMNRSYTREEFLDIIKKIRNKKPDIKIGTDIIVGFPGEGEKEFQNTVELCREVGFDVAFVSIYSPRSGTAAFNLKDDVSRAEKKRRWRELQELIKNTYTAVCRNFQS